MKKRALSLFLTLALVVGLLSGLTITASAGSTDAPTMAIWNSDNTPFNSNDSFCVGQTYTFTSYATATTYDASANPTTTYYDHSWTYGDGDAAINLTDGGEVSWGDFSFSAYWGSGWQVTFTPKTTGTYTINFTGSSSHADVLNSCSPGSDIDSYGSITITVSDKTVSVYRENDAYSDSMYWFAGNTYNLSAYVYSGNDYTATKWICPSGYSAPNDSWVALSETDGIFAASSNDFGCNLAFTPPGAGTYSFKIQSVADSATYKILQITVLPAGQYNLTFEGALLGDTSTPVTADNVSISVTMVNGTTTSYSESLTATLAAGEYTYTVSADGYSPASGTLTLFKDQTQTVSLYGASLAGTLKDNIAAAFSSDASNYWRVIGLMALANEFYPVSSQDKETILSNAIDNFSNADAYSATSKAMNIIALTALGYDVSQVVNDGSCFNAYDKLAVQLAADVEPYGGWAEVYAYSLMAYLQGSDTVRSDYADEISAYISALTPTGDGNWLPDGHFSPDSAGIALAALCMARDEGYTVDAAVISGLVSDLESKLTTNGTYIDSFSSASNADSTALAIVGLDAAGVDVSALTAFGSTTTLLSGLLSFAAEDNTGFAHESGTVNTTSTQEGFLALAAVLDNGATNVFDFIGNGTAITESATHYLNCPVVISVVPLGATITVESGGSEVFNVGISGRYDLPAGNYTAIVSASGYESKTKDFTITHNDAANHSRIRFSVSLSHEQPPDSGGGSTITVTAYVKVPNANDINNDYTYKKNSSAYVNLIDRQVLTFTSGSTAFDVLDTVLTNADMHYEESLTSPGYITTIGTLSEFNHGSNSGWMYSVNGTVYAIGSRDYTLNSNATVIWFYTDSYPDEFGSEQWGGTDTTNTSSNALTAGSDGAAGIDADALDDIVTAGKGFSVKAAAGTVSLTAAGASSLQSAAGSGALTVSVTAATAQNSGFTVVADSKAIAALTVSVKTGDTLIHNGFGTMTVTADVGKTYASKTLSILHLKDDGTYEILTGTVDADGILSFDTSSLSTFVVFTASTLPVQYVFSDVAADAWYADYVRYVYENGIMAGTSDTGFSPDTLMSRGMLVTVLWRMNGKPSSSKASDFTDVSDSAAWYYDAVKWASENGIVGGYGDGTFGPNDNVTREQLVTIFYRYAQYNRYGTGNKAELNGYTDAGSISTWALPAFRWAVGNGIVSGTTTSTVSPTGGASRCMAAAIIERFAEKAPSAEASDDSANPAYEKTAAYYLASAAPGFGGEWEIIGLCEGGYTLPQGFLTEYYNKLCDYLVANGGVLSERKYTEYSRTVYALTVAGYDATDVAGYDLTAPLADYDATIYQGINGPIWALIALDSGNYESSLRQSYLDLILDRELPGGGWTLSGTVADADMTAMALCALAPYTDNATVAAAAARGITALSKIQNADGGFSSGGIANAESCAQVVRALCTLDIDLDDARFVKNGCTALDGLLSYQLADGSFEHILASGSNYTSTQQAFYALAAAK